MSHEIVNIDGQWSFVQANNVEDAWHHLGQKASPEDDLDVWLKAGNLNFEVNKVPGLYMFNDELRDSGLYHNVCSDTGQSLGVFTERYKVHQPRQICEMFDRLLGIDPRFQRYSMAALKGRSVIFNCARFTEDMEAAGEPHKAFLTSFTSFDGSLATGNMATMMATVCNNTLQGNLAANTSKVHKVRHSSALCEAKQDRMNNELEQVIASFGHYKQMADAMAIARQSAADTELLLKNIFFGKDKVPTEIEDMKTQTKNQLEDLMDCYRITIEEGREIGTVWATLNAVTRYVDHNRTTRDHNGDGELMSRFASAQFGSGQAMKARAVEYLTEYMGRELQEAA